MKQVLPLLVKSNFLTFKELNDIHWVLRIEWKTIDFILNCEPQECGHSRYLQWKRSLFIDPDRDIEADRRYYNSILNPSNDADANPQLHEGTLRLSGVMGEISRDVVRTYQTNPLFREGGSGRDMLQRILSSLVKSRPEVGYCQGMNFVVGAIILGRLPNSLSKQAVNHDSDEEENGDEQLPEPIKLPEALMNQVECDVFMLMLELFDRNNKLAMCGLWAPRVPKLKLRVYQLDRLLKWNYPKLHDHFAKLQLSPEVLTAQWFVTLFAYNLPLETTLHLWDYLFETGWEGIFKVAISLLGAMEPQFMALEDLESFALLMREWKKLGHLNIDMSVNALLNKCHKLVINEEVLTRLQECFGMEILSLAIYCYKEDAKLNNKEGTSTPGGSFSGGSVHGGGMATPNGSISSTVGLHGGSQHNAPQHHQQNHGSHHHNHHPHHHQQHHGHHHGAHHQSHGDDGSHVGGSVSGGRRQSSNETTSTAWGECDPPLGQGKYIAKVVKKVIKVTEGAGSSAGGGGPGSPHAGSSGGSGPSSPVGGAGGAAAPAKELSIGQGKYLNLAMKSVGSLFGSSSSTRAGSSAGSTVGTPSPGSSFSGSVTSVVNNNTNNPHQNISAFHQESLSMSAPTPADVEEQEEDEKIKLGEEVPTYWLLRYGSKLNSSEIDQLINYKILLRRLEKTVDVDKAQLHSKIIKACEYHRETEEELALAEEAVRFHGDNVTRLTEEFQEALLHAQDLAEAVAKLMDVYSVKKVTSPGDMKGSSAQSGASRDVSGFGGIHNVVTPTKNRSNSIGSFLSGNSAGKSQSMTSLNSLMRERGLISASPVPPSGASGSGSNGNSSGGGVNEDGIAAGGGRSVLPDRRFSFRASLFSEKTDSESAGNGAASNAPATRRASGSSAFIFTGMRSAVRFPAGLVTTPVAAQPSDDVSRSNGSSSKAVAAPAGEDPLTAQNSGSSGTENLNQQQSGNSRTMSHGLNDLLVAAESGDKVGPSSDEEEVEVDLTRASEAVPARGRMIGIAGNESTLVGMIDENELSSGSGGGGAAGRRSWSDRFKTGLSSLRSGGSSSGQLAPEIGSEIRPDIHTGRNLATDVPGPSTGKLLRELAGDNGAKTRTTEASGGSGGEPLTKNVSFETVSSYTDGSNKAVSFSQTPTSQDGSSTPVRQAVDGASGKDNSSVGSSGSRSDLSPSSDGITRQLKHLEAQSKNSQQTIIEVHRALEEEKKNLRASKKRLETAKISGDEALVWKKSLCDQLQLLVEDYNKGRTQKLLFISENYLL